MYDKTGVGIPKGIDNQIFLQEVVRKSILTKKVGMDGFMKSAGSIEGRITVGRVENIKKPIKASNAWIS